MRRPKLDHWALVAIKDNWINQWNEGNWPEGLNEHASMWSKAVLDQLYKLGNDIVTAELQKAEQQLAARGLEREYVDALITVTKASQDNMLSLITASSTQRAKAIDVVLALEIERTAKEEEAQ